MEEMQEYAGLNALWGRIGALRWWETDSACRAICQLRVSRGSKCTDLDPSGIKICSSRVADYEDVPLSECL